MREWLLLESQARYLRLGAAGGANGATPTQLFEYLCAHEHDTHLVLDASTPRNPLASYTHHMREQRAYYASLEPAAADGEVVTKTQPTLKVHSHAVRKSSKRTRGSKRRTTAESMRVDDEQDGAHAAALNDVDADDVDLLVCRLCSGYVRHSERYRCTDFLNLYYLFGSLTSVIFA